MAIKTHGLNYIVNRDTVNEATSLTVFENCNFSDFHEGEEDSEEVRVCE